MNVLIWAIILVVVLRAYAKQWLSWVVAAILVVVLPYVVEVGAQMIAFAVWDKEVSGVIAMVHPVTVILQLMIALGVLYWLERHDESLTVWAIGVGTLFLGLVYGAPYVAMHWPL